MVEFVPIDAVAPGAVEALLDRAFGPQRREKTAYRVRAGLRAIPELSFAACDGATLVGSIQCWPVELQRDCGPTVPMIMVGPIAIEPALQLGGLGKRITRHALAAADAASLAGAQAQMLVGDPEYYARFFGFSDGPTGQWRLPGPFEPRRLLARGSVPTEAGLVVGRVLASA